MLTLLLVLAFFCILFGFGGGYYGWYGPAVGWSPLGLILVVLIVLWLTGFRF